MQADEHLQENEKGQRRAVVLREPTVGVQRRQHRGAVAGHVGGRQENILLQHQRNVLGLLRAGLCDRSAIIFGKRRFTHAEEREDQVGKVSSSTRDR